MWMGEATAASVFVPLEEFHQRRIMLSSKLPIMFSFVVPTRCISYCLTNESNYTYQTFQFIHMHLRLRLPISPTHSIHATQPAKYPHHHMPSRQTPNSLWPQSRVSSQSPHTHP